MTLYSYVVARDYGFAPNPFFGVCTLATCKPLIRKAAGAGDWILGIAPKRRGNRIVYFMQVDGKLTFDEYWADPRFQLKKPNLNSSRMYAFGDNIYHRDAELDEWHQENSHHSYPTGAKNPTNILTDTSHPYVLYGVNFTYFGKSGSEWPDDIISADGETVVVSRSHRCNFSSGYAEKVLNHLKEIGFLGLVGEPLDWKRLHG